MLNEEGYRGGRHGSRGSNISHVGCEHVGAVTEGGSDRDGQQMDRVVSKACSKTEVFGVYSVGSLPGNM